MSLDYWKLGGGLKSYNPLPFNGGIGVSVPFKGFRTYIATLKAKSSLGGRLRVSDSSNNGYSNNTHYQLDGNFKTITHEFTLGVDETFHLIDVDSKGDIQVDEIKVIQKSLPKLTINGIDGFNSGKWTLHANARIIDDETLELNATGAGQYSYFDVPVISGQTYIFAVEGVGHVYGYKRQSVAGVDLIVNHSLTVKNTDIINVDGSFNGFFRIALSNTTTGKFTFKKPMLNLGTTPAPFAKKTGDKMVLPTPKGNLLPFSSSLKGVGTTNGAWHNPVNGVNLLGNITLGYPINLQKDKPYTISGKLTEGEDFQLLNTTASLILSPSNKTIVPTKDETFYFRVKIGSSLAFQLDNIMLNEGTTAQPYTPYAVQVNKKPKRYVPKKNLFNVNDSTNELEKTLNTVGGTVAYAGRSVSHFIEVKPSTNYVGFTGWFRISFYDNAKTFISYNDDSSIVRATPSNCRYIRFSYPSGTQPQIEEGTTATPYEPYTQVLPRAKTKKSAKRNLEAKR